MSDPSGRGDKARADHATLDPYEVLGVQRGASDGAIAAAHKRLAREFHPDIAGEQATIRMMQINAAFDSIRTSDRRADFDDFGPRSPGAAGRGPGGAGTSAGGAMAGGAGSARWTSERDGTGGAGPPPGRPSGSVLQFGRHIGWSLGEIARVDPGYLEWLAQQRDGRRYAPEIDAILRRTGNRADDQTASGRR
jgi:curved DNA-binding protein CbpA